MPRKLRHILLVDDSPDDNFIHTRAIRKSGLAVEISVKRDGVEAIELLRSAPVADLPDLILLDIKMPRLDGWGFLEQLASLPDERRNHVLVIMVSTSTNLLDKERSRRYPMITEFLSKPITADEIQRIVADHFKAGAAEE